MPDETLNPGATAGCEWTKAADLDRLHPSHPIAVKIAGKHIALFLHRGEVLACNNRCPHEGYPLVEGVLDGNSREWPIDGEPERTRCVLTCNWHNWKFDLRTGATLYGGDNLRTYPVSVRDGAIWLDLRDAPAQERIARALEHVDAAMAEHDSARIARELARLGRAGVTPEIALARAIATTHTRLRDGMTHAYAAAEAWLRLRDTLTDDAMRLACAGEALAYVAFDTLREREYPYAGKRLPWNAHALASAVEAQDEECGLALLAGALDAGLGFDDLEPILAEAALAHYNDFGHSLIYLSHVKKLIARLGREVERALLYAWTRSLIYATREDLLPDFRGYAAALKAWQPAAAATTRDAGANCAVSASIASSLADAIEGKPARVAMEVVAAAAARAGFQETGSRGASSSARDNATALALHAGLMEASARHLLRIDESHATRTNGSVATGSRPGPRSGTRSKPASRQRLAPRCWRLSIGCLTRASSSGTRCPWPRRRCASSTRSIELRNIVTSCFARPLADAGLIALFMLAQHPALAQSFPSKPVKLSAPYSAGAAPAVFTRTVADKLAKMWGQPVIVDAKPGASGFIAIEAVKNAPPDGHDLLVVSNAHVAINPSLYKKLPYDPQKDLVPVAMFYHTPFFLAVATSGSYQSVEALVIAAKAKPGSVSYGSSYVGSPSHLGSAEFEFVTGTSMIHAPFKDQSQMYVGIANGDLGWAFTTLGSALPLMQAGRLKLIAVATPRRSRAMPDVPTLVEAGGPSMTVGSWLGIMAPRGTPPAVIRKINADVNRALAEPDVVTQLNSFGFEAAPMTPEQMGDEIRADAKKFAELVKRTGASAD